MTIPIDRETALKEALDIIKGARLNFSPKSNPSGCRLLDKGIAEADAALTAPTPAALPGNNVVMYLRDCWKCDQPAMQLATCEHCSAKNPWGQQPDEPDTQFANRERRTIKRRLAQPPTPAAPTDGPSDSQMLEWIGDNLVRAMCYSEPDENGDWYAVTYHKRSDSGPTHLSTKYGASFRSAIRAAMEAQP